jgi:hypothetical protein
MLKEMLRMRTLTDNDEMCLYIYVHVRVVCVYKIKQHSLLFLADCKGPKANLIVNVTHA